MMNSLKFKMGQTISPEVSLQGRQRQLKSNLILAGQGEKQNFDTNKSEFYTCSKLS